MLQGRSKGVKQLLCLRLVLSQRRLQLLSLPQRLLPTRDDRLALRLVLRGGEKSCGADGLQLQKLIMQASLALGLVRHHDDELTSLKRLLGAFRFCLQEVFWTFPFRHFGIFGAAGSPMDRGAQN